MKQVLCKEKYNKGGIDTFESNIVPELTEKGFEPVRYRTSSKYFFSEVLSRFRAARSLKRGIRKETEAVFIPDHTVMSFIDPEDFDAEIVPYVHDIFPVTTNFSGYFATLLGQKYVENIKKCERIICNSHYVEKEMKERAGYTGETEVIYQGVGMPEPEEIKTYDEREYDFIYIGGLTPRKNQKFVREFAEKIQETRYKMVAVNRKPLNLACEVKTDISDEELADLLDNSRYYLHPSFQEGFGRGAVEAQRRGVPVIARENQVNQEILDSFILLESLRDTVSMKTGEWKKKSDKARRNAKRYSWDKTTRKISEFIQPEY